MKSEFSTIWYLALQSTANTQPSFIFYVRDLDEPALQGYFFVNSTLDIRLLLKVLEYYFTYVAYNTKSGANST